jgi:hypothetical protein
VLALQSIRRIHIELHYLAIAPSKMVMTSYPFPANAVPCSTSTGVNFMAPAGFSVSNIAANGVTNGLTGAGAAVGQFGLRRAPHDPESLPYP